MRLNIFIDMTRWVIDKFTTCNSKVTDKFNGQWDTQLTIKLVLSSKSFRDKIYGESWIKGGTQLKIKLHNLKLRNTG